MNQENFSLSSTRKTAQPVTPPPIQPPANSLIRLEKISKSFGMVKANTDICLDIRAGKIKALLGENGAGKSTLMHILAGALTPDTGQIIINGHPVSFSSTRNAIRAGIGMVYQHFMLVPAMTVAENVFLGQEEGIWLNHNKMNERVEDLATKYRLEIDPTAKVSSLSMGEKQRVEILKLLQRKSEVLIFDEPTAVLTPQETKQLFAAFSEMAAQKKAIVFISHKLPEVMDVADEIAILRKGTVTDEINASAITCEKELARRMVGREVVLQVKKQSIDIGNPVLNIKGLHACTLKGIDLDLRQGEILGVVGVAGNGQKPLVETLCGIISPEGGSIEILGKSIKNFFASRSTDGTLSYIPEDRTGIATCKELDLRDNFLLTTRKDFTKGPWLQRKKAGAATFGIAENFSVHPLNIKARARHLSGGNLQKMVLGREFFRNPKLIVAEQPTQGLDIAATEEIWQHLLEARKKAGILLITGDLTEALALSDRIAVIYRGQIMDVFPVKDNTQHDRIGPLMAGICHA